MGGSGLPRPGRTSLESQAKSGAHHGMIPAIKGSNGLWELGVNSNKYSTPPKYMTGINRKNQTQRAKAEMAIQEMDLQSSHVLSVDVRDERTDLRDAQSTSYTISIRNLSYKVHNRQSAKSSPAPGASQSLHSGPLVRQITPLETSPASSSEYILKEVSCKALPGEILAVAGPSGAGKSTLLDALAGRIRLTSLEGDILVNNRPIDAKHFRRITGYVMQDDALFPMLTVRETLLYSARLRLPGGMAMKEKKQRVEDLIKELGLTAAAETRIGNAEVRGVSGGERRRVSIGVDLIHDPGVLLLDEPTSGLDSSAALNIVEVLHDMAVHGRRTVILSIHQPSFRILELFHKVLLLSQGAVAHHGTMETLVSRFRAMGEEIPPHVNALEYAIDTLDLQQHRRGGAARHSSGGSALPDQRLRRAASLSSRLQATVEVERESSQSNDKGPPEEGSSLGPAMDASQLHSEPLGYACSPRQEILTLTTRYYKNIFRTKELFNGRAAQVAICGACLGTLFFNVGHNQRGQAERLGFLAFSLAFLLTSSVEALPIFLQERQILIRETTSGAYRKSSYLLASTLVFLPFLLVLAILFSAPAYWLVGFYDSIDAFLFFVLVVWLVLITANSIVACFAAISPNYITGNSMIAAIMGAYFLFSGYFIAQEYIPSYWIWAHYLSVFKYPFDALLINEYGSMETTCFSQDPSLPDVCLQTGSQILDSGGLGNTSKWMNVGILAAYATVYRLGCYCALKYLQKSTRR